LKLVYIIKRNMAATKHQSCNNIYIRPLSSVQNKFCINRTTFRDPW